MGVTPIPVEFNRKTGATRAGPRRIPESIAPALGSGNFARLARAASTVSAVIAGLGRTRRRGAVHLALVAAAALLLFRALLALRLGVAGQRTHLGLGHLHPHAALELARQLDRAVAHAHQAAHGPAHGLDHAAPLAIASLGQRHAVPVVRALAAFVTQARETCRAILQLDARGQHLDLLVLQPAEQAHGILALHL